MSAFFELLDLDSGNVIADYATQDDVMKTLQRIASEDGMSSLQEMALLRIDDGHQELIAMRDDLVEMVSEAAATVVLP